MTNTVYTVGHSTHSIEAFITLLMRHRISALCDVRSHPRSRMNPQFNSKPLKASLKEAGIKYVFLGTELGARSEDKSCYRDGQVQYDLLAETELFKQGIERVKNGATKFRVALMCAEKEPLECHRTILVARKLHDEGMAIQHILGNGEIEEHARTIQRLVSQLRVPGADMFREDHEVVKDAYAKQANAIAYREENSSEAETHELLSRAVE